MATEAVDAEEQEEHDKEQGSGDDPEDVQFEAQASEETALVQSQATGISAIPTKPEWDVMTNMVERLAPLVGTDFLPNQIKSPHAALAIVLKGRELGVPPMEALAQLYAVNGRVAMQGQLMLALIARRKLGTWDIEEGDGYCDVTMTRADNGVSYTSHWTVDRAKQADLLHKDAWNDYLETMLKWRAVTDCGRTVFPDVLGGLYTPEELNVPVVVNDGTVEIDVERAPEPDPIDADFEVDEGWADEWPAPPTCPVCGKPMKRRSGKRGDFWGCTGYPKCKNTYNIGEAPWEQGEDDVQDADFEEEDGTEYEGEVDAERLDDADEDPFDYREARPTSLAEFNAVALEPDWTDEHRKHIYATACKRLYSEMRPPQDLEGQQYADVWALMCDVDDAQKIEEEMAS